MRRDVLFLLLIVGLVMRVAFAVPVDGFVPFGEDAEFWGYRAVEMGSGIPGGEHPPLYPLLAMLVGLLPGVDVATGAMLVSWVAGVAMAPVMALGVASLAGERAGTFAGVLTLLLPNLLAWSIRIEPSGLFVVLLGVALLQVGPIVHARSRGAALRLGLLLALLELTKENGGIFLLALALPAVFARREGRWILLGLVLLGVALPWGPYQLLSPGLPDAQEKGTLPFTDMYRFLAEGRAPPPLRAGDDPFLRVDAEVLQALGQEPVVDRLAWVARQQVLRLSRFLGVWLVIAPLAAAGAVALWRRGRLEGWKLALLLVAQALLVAMLVVFVQARHAEVALLGTIWTTAVVLAAAWETGSSRMRVAIGGLGLALAAQQAWLIGTLEITRARSMTGYAHERAAAARWIAEHVPEDAILASPVQWTGFLLEQRTVWNFFGPPMEGSTWLVYPDERSVRERGVPSPHQPVRAIRALEAGSIGRQILAEGRVEERVPSAEVPLDVLVDGAITTRDVVRIDSPGTMKHDRLPESVSTTHAGSSEIQEEEGGEAGPLGPAEPEEEEVLSFPHPDDLEGTGGPTRPPVAEGEVPPRPPGIAPGMGRRPERVRPRQRALREAATP